jgi:hypothetical protein
LGFFNNIGIKLKVTAYVILVTGIILSVVLGLYISGGYEQINKIKSFWMLIISVIGGFGVTAVLSFCVYALGEIDEFMKQNYNLFRRMAKAERVIVSSKVNKY